MHNLLKVALSRLVGPLEGCPPQTPLGVPSHIREYLWGGHFWSPAHFAASCDGAPLANVKEYIGNQKRPC
ncbi:transposase [Streptomyces sp. NPDC049097]|uniref:transposase n=1 Tax=unclassified Streptomyces TaxID=2593676 RepID=UPI0033D623E4